MICSFDCRNDIPPGEHYFSLVDLDRYLASHRPSWDRLEQLTEAGRHKIARLSPSELDELVKLYSRTSSNLSYAQTYFDDPSLNAYLTRLVSSAGALIYGTSPRTMRHFTNFFSVTFPAALWRCRYFCLVSAIALFLPAIAFGLWLANSDAAADIAIPPDVREAYINNDFESYYESERASQFASTVFTNNVRVGIQAFAGGIFLGLPTIAVLFLNGVNLGVAAGIFAHFDALPKFFGLITPHGLLELTAITISGGAGLQLGWTLIDPGDRRRVDALREEGRRIIVIVLGLIPVFGVAGLIEGFVTGQPWPTWLRVGIGVFAEVAFLAYVFLRGPAASRRGFTGAIGEQEETGWAVARS